MKNNKTKIGIASILFAGIIGVTQIERIVISDCVTVEQKVSPYMGDSLVIETTIQSEGSDYSRVHKSGYTVCHYTEQDKAKKKELRKLKEEIKEANRHCE